MKKTWKFGMALAFGISCLPSLATAQYAPYGNGALAPSGYAINPSYNTQPMAYPMVPQAGMVGPQMAQQMAQQMPQQMPGMQPMQMQTMQVPQMQVPQMPNAQFQQAQYPVNQNPAMHMVAYPQETILAPNAAPGSALAPSINTQQPVEKGWIGPNHGAYQAAPVPDSAPMQSAPGQGAPMQGAVQGQVYSDPSYNGGCAGGCGGGYNSTPMYGSMLAPAATAPVYGGASCGPVYAQPVYASQGMSLGNVGGFMRGYGAVPGKAIFAGGSALLMTRVDDHNVALSYNTAMPSENILGTRDARQYDLNGFEVFAGRYFNCGRNAILLNYWGLYPEDRSTEVTGAAGPTGYRSRYPFTGIEMPTQTVYDWFDGALSHRVTRGSQYHNFEANLLGFAAGGAARTWVAAAPRRGAFGVGGYGGGYAGGYGSGYGCGGYDACGSCGTGSCGSGSCGTGYSDCGSCGTVADCGSCGSGCASFTGPCGLTPNACGSKLNWTWLGGFRYFRFTDDLQYAASDTDAIYGGVDDIYYDVNVRNSLAGFQLGGAGTYCLGRRFNVYALSKGGVYNNYSEYHTRIYRTGGPTATINSTNIYNGDGFMVDSSKNQLAFLGEFGTGVGVRVSRGWSANVGYRVIGAAGVATAVNNIPFDMTHLGNVADYNNTSSLVLHGWTLGGMYNF